MPQPVMLKKLKLNGSMKTTRPRMNTQKSCPFHYRGLECKSRKSKNTWSRLLYPWDFPGKSTGVGCHCLLQHKLCYRLYSLKMVMTIFPIPLTHIQCDSLKVESMSPPLESGWASKLQPNKCSGSDTTWLSRLVQKRRPSFPPCYLENLDLEPWAMRQEI